MGANAYGVHIRRGDHSYSTKMSPLELFVQRMDTLIASESDATFYLATDSEQVKQELHSRYGNRVHSYQGELSRSSVIGMQGAVIDLFCLSRTKQILGSTHSSYSEVASELGHIPLEVISINNQK